MRSLILALALLLPIAAQPIEPTGGLCCLCECRSADQDKCTKYCIRLQHSKRIVDTPAIKKCTRKCHRAHVVEVPKGWEHQYE